MVVHLQFYPPIMLSIFPVSSMWVLFIWAHLCHVHGKIEFVGKDNVFVI
jgi:hypothetical protein